MTQIEKLAETMSTAIKGWTQKRLEDMRSSVLETVKGMLEANPPKDGAQGPQGIQGEKGERGEQGEKGLKGDAGERGETGEKGSDGQAGERGDPGQAGEQGPKGDPGPAGERGEQGLQGERGERGEKGEPGPAGDRGEPGEKGEDGKSVSLDEVRSMLDELVSKHVNDAVTKAVSSIPAPKDGEPGKDADQEAIRASVMAEVMKAFNEIPRPLDGRDGQRGEPGRDAIQIVPLSAIDEQKQYGRGTFASHKGGFWHAFKTTEGMDGWECLVKGVEAIECLQDPEDPREIGIGIKMSDGQVIVKRFHVPFVVDKGVYKEGQQYKAGDGVTWARNYWIATKDTTEKPDFGGDFRLAVKGGRDGKDGRDGIDRTAAVKL